MSPCGPEVRFVFRHKGFAARQVSVSASPSSEPVKLSRRLIGWRSATHESDVLLLLLTVWAFLTHVSNTPAADFCGRVRVNYFTLSREYATCHRSPAISSAAFDTRPLDLPPASLMDTDFVVSCQLVRRRRPPIQFLYIGPYLCSTLPSDPTSR